MRIDSSGNVGIGTSSPNSRLFVGGSGACIRLDDATNGQFSFECDANANNIFSGNSGFSAWKNLKLSAANLIFATDGTFERARIDSSGNLLVGATANISDSNSGLIQVVGATSTRNGIGVKATGSGTQYLIGFYNSSSAVVGSVSTNGTTTTYNTSSDYRLKNITGPITNSGAYIDSLKPVEGTWKVDGSAFVGLIAHEVQEVSRTQVATGEKDGKEMQAMDYSSSEIIANLIAEVKSLRARVAQLESN